MLGVHVGGLLTDCKWVGVPFAGGMGELLHMKARTMLVSDLHRHVINLARVVADDDLRPKLIERLSELAFHPDELLAAQQACRKREAGQHAGKDCVLWWAADYFVAAWMGRSGLGGVDDEFCGRTATRWNANGGDSNVRYRNAIAGLEAFSAVLKRCTFETMDAFDFLGRCEDNNGHGIYCDPPFPVAGRRYKHNAGKTTEEEVAWHTRLRDAAERFERTKVVMRFYDHPLIRELYSSDRWRWIILEGRKQSNEAAPEVLLVNQRDAGLFDGLEA